MRVPCSDPGQGGRVGQGRWEYPVLILAKGWSWAGEGGYPVLVLARGVGLAQGVRCPGFGWGVGGVPHPGPGWGVPCLGPGGRGGRGGVPCSRPGRETDGMGTLNISRMHHIHNFLF